MEGQSRSRLMPACGGGQRAQNEAHDQEIWRLASLTRYGSIMGRVMLSP